MAVRSRRAVPMFLFMALITIAMISARDYAGGWNDGSRLATVESLVDYQTFKIDRSIFAEVPADLSGPAPYGPDEFGVPLKGTMDRLFINGHFYSDKPPVPAVLMAGLYKVLQWGTGLSVRERADRFCYWMTVGSSGVAYVAAAWSIYRLAELMMFPLSLRLLLTASFALSTIALPYTRHVNGHILLLGIAGPLFLGLTQLADERVRGTLLGKRAVVLGTLAGMGYGIDLGAGPILFVCTLTLIVYRCRSFRFTGLFVLAALPWLGLHHAINYSLGGTLKPASAVAEYLLWPGSPFTTTMTGQWNHSSVGRFLLYAAALLVGKRGFLTHNLPLLLAVVGGISLLRSRVRYFPEIVCACCFSVGTWLLYAVFSNNYSGVAASIRWFVPLLAPGYLILAVFLREQPQYWPHFLVLSVWGSIMAGLMWWQGPWMSHMVYLFWLWVGAALISWISVHYGSSGRKTLWRGSI